MLEAVSKAYRNPSSQRNAQQQSPKRAVTLKLISMVRLESVRKEKKATHLKIAKISFVKDVIHVDWQSRLGNLKCNLVPIYR